MKYIDPSQCSIGIRTRGRLMQTSVQSSDYFFSRDEFFDYGARKNFQLGLKLEVKVAGGHVFSGGEKAEVIFFFFVCMKN